MDFLRSVRSRIVVALAMHTPRQWFCNHHWHPSGAMIAWQCCWCAKDVDGWPRDRIRLCNKERWNS